MIRGCSRPPPTPASGARRDWRNTPRIGAARVRVAAPCQQVRGPHDLTGLRPFVVDGPAQCERVRRLWWVEREREAALVAPVGAAADVDPPRDSAALDLGPELVRAVVVLRREAHVHLRAGAIARHARA